MSRHHLLTDFVLDINALGPSTGFARTATAQAISEILMSPEAFAAFLGAIDAASSRPPVPALDRYLLRFVGVEAASDAAKIYTGRILRQIVEHIGGEWVRSGVPITEPSIFANSSTYRLPGRSRGRLKAAERLAWAQEWIARLKGA